ncbi:hypothetical protein AVEN_32827-1 [Araneus ventricosus]|uniref:Uncharacterized protein n=1 Tax=Araneus ventricosus TaxID=182803 RepID=A0A4Y2DYK0_ARAVE|nr:hypothetical protein AVEN_32827-1 [Araneus ventricosus]
MLKNNPIFYFCCQHPFSSTNAKPTAMNKVDQLVMFETNRKLKRLATNQMSDQRQQRLATLRNSQKASRLRRIDQLQPQTTNNADNDAKNSTQSRNSHLCNCDY